MLNANSLDDLLTDLRDETRPLAQARLEALSDLDRAELQRFRLAWEAIPAARRAALITRLHALADEKIELTFERIHRLALSDPEPEVRRLAILGLWECEDPALARPLLRALADDPAAAVRTEAAAALSAFVVLGELDRLPGDLLHRIEQGLLQAASHDGAPEVQRACVQALGYSSREEVPDLIRAAYAREGEAWKRCALSAMGRSADAPWAPIVLAELLNPAPALRLEAARAAGELELRQALPHLLDLLDDAQESIRRAAIWSLGQIGGDAAARALTRLLRRAEDEDEIDLLDRALENLAFVDGARDLVLFDLDDDAGDEA